jgi:ribonuclease HII
MKGLIGVDEVGRGCLAGPMLVVAARQLKPLPPTAVDSKKLNRTQRAGVYEQIRLLCDFGEGWVRVAEIEKFGLTKATKIGVKRALQSIDAEVNEEIIIDGHINYAPAKFKRARPLIDADNLVPIVSAASIFAKLKRDLFMIEQAKVYSGYGFERHVGYGTKFHLQAIETIGLIDGFHRQTFAPFKVLNRAA